MVQEASESLAGRVGIVELGTLKFNEFEKRPLPDFYQIFNSDLNGDSIEALKNLQNFSKEDIIEYFLKGSYPDPFFLKEDLESHKLWYQNYHDTYLNRDLKKLFPKLDSIKYRRFLSMLSDLSGTIINKAQLGRSVDVSETTIKDYLQIAHQTLVWRMIPSFEKSMSKSITKMPKGIFRDSGLNWFLSQIDSREKLIRSSRVGQNFESFVIEEIIRGLESTTLAGWHYAYYRTRNGSEVDLIIDGSFGILPIEIKWGVSTHLKQIRSLISFIEQNNLAFGVVINNSAEIKMLHKKVIQIPVKYI